MIGDESFVDDVALLVQNAKSVLLVAEIKTDGDGWYFRFHGSDIVSQRSRAASHCLLI